MCNKFSVIFVLLIMVRLGFSNFQNKYRHNNLPPNDTDSDTSRLYDFDTRSDLIPSYHNRSARNFEPLYTEWTKWSRCLDCMQRRVKTCISPNCHSSRMYEERECHKKRCKRKTKKKISFHVVHLNTSRSYLTKQAPSEVWSKWSKWLDCSSKCRTYRVRKCKKPGRCRKYVQRETAYCYHERTSCEMWVLNLLEEKQRETSLDDRKYQYSFDSNQFITREPRTRPSKCGAAFNKPHMLKIIGGSEAPKYKWPWHVAILNQFQEVFCGGTLISSRWVLTANHCIRRNLKVRLNAHDLRAKDGRDIIMSVHKTFGHPDFEVQTVDNDIALLLLPQAVRLPVACLPTRKPKVGKLCSVMGWGKVHTTHSYGVPILHEAQLPLVAHKICKKAYKELLISGNMLCAGWKSGKSDTCAGDSGGGLMCPTRKKTKKVTYSVQGITSFGDGCGIRNKYGIYTAVFNYVEWINNIIDLYS